MQNTDYLKLLGKILVFNQGSKLCLNFLPTHDRPTFLWFWDTFYSDSHKGLNSPVKLKSRYLNFFILDPKTNPKIVAGQELKSFYAICKHFIQVKNRIISSDPPILRSWDTLVPNLVFDFQNEEKDTANIIFPEHLTGKKIKFFDDKKVPLNYFEIPEFIGLLPELKECKTNHKIFTKLLQKKL